jgi:hypothetical protein
VNPGNDPTTGLIRRRPSLPGHFQEVVWDPLEPRAGPVCVRDPVHILGYAAREVRKLGGYEVPAEAIVATTQGGKKRD